MRIWGLLVLSICLAWPVWAQTMDDARSAYHEGDFATVLQIVEPMAAREDADALNMIGILYRNGLGVPSDAPRALGYFERAAIQDFSASLYNLGDLLQDGAPGVPVDLGRAETLYLRAIAVDDNPGAMNNLAVLLEVRDAPDADWPRIVDLYRRATEGGDIDAPVNLALLLFNESGGYGDPVEARRLLEAEVAETGYGRAERLLGYFNEIGSGGPQDTGRAIALCQAAVADGVAEAAVDLGVMHRLGAPGLAVDLGAAADWFRRASGMGSADGANELGLLMIDGDPRVPDNIQFANDLFRLAHDRGLDHGSRNLAISYWHGEGVARDLAEARRLMEIATANRLPDALSDLGVMLDDGIGGPMDPLGARALFREAAEVGLALAGLNLAGSLMRAEGPQPDPTEGLAWCYWAIERADNDTERADYIETCARRRAAWPQLKIHVVEARCDALLAQF